MRRLQLQAQSYAKLEDLDDGLLSQLLNLHLLDFVAVLWIDHKFELIYLVNTHLLVQEHWIHMMCVLVEPGLLDGSALQLAVDQRATLSAAFPLEAWLPNQRGFLEARSIRTLAAKALEVFLRHLSPFGLALLNNMHPYLHSQALLMFAKLVVQWLRHCDPLRRYLLCEFLIGTQVLVDDAACQVVLRLLDTVDALRVVRGFERGL